MAKTIVIDSSVIGKWLNKNNEKHVDQADKILEDARLGEVILYSSELSKYEIGNVLVNAKKLSQSEAKIPLSVLFNLPIEFVALSPELAKNSFAIASEFGIKYFDSVSLALAEEKDAVFVTDNATNGLNASGIEVTQLKDY